MKVRESGMPEQATWEAFFDVETILSRLGLTSGHRDIVEFGCGYGTFTIPAARRANGTVYALDIDPLLLDAARQRAAAAGVGNIEFVERDFVEHGSGLADGSADFAMLFNILHHEDAVALLREARRNLRPGGIAGIIHWIPDPDTPRGPPMSIRPRPEQCADWARQAGFTISQDNLALPPYHYGIVATRE